MPSSRLVLGRQPSAASRLESISFRGVPSGFVGIEDECPFKPCSAANYLRKLADADLGAGAAIDWVAPVVPVHQKHDGIGQIVDIKKFPQGVPVPQTVTSVSPLAFAAWNFRIKAGKTWLVARSKLSFGP